MIAEAANKTQHPGRVSYGRSMFEFNTDPELNSKYERLNLSLLYPRERLSLL